MKKLIFILFLSPLLSMGQMVPFGFMADVIAAGCTADPNEQVTTGNAFSDPNCNETNGVAGTNTNFATRTSDASDPNVGSYALAVESPDGGTGFVYYGISVTSGDDFDVSYDAKESVGSNANFFIGGLAISNNGSQNLTTSWVTYSFSTTANATGTMQLRWYPARSNGAGNKGDIVLVDNVSVIKTN